jgi:FkbM family methyltransferase
MAPVSTHRLLPLAYRALLTLTRRHGLFTLARLHHRLWAGEQRVGIPGGSELLIPPDEHYFGFLSGMHEPHIARLIAQQVRAGDTCMDVGANIGYFAMMMAARCGGSGRVYAFEPVPDTFELLEKNAALASTHRWHLLPQRKAISNVAGEVSLLRQEHSTLNQVSLSPVTNETTEKLPSITLDAFTQDKGIEDIRLLKVDVEGHELPVLQGALNLLRHHRVKHLVIEVTPGEQAKGVSLMLTEIGARCYCWVDSTWREQSAESLTTRTDVWAEFPV